VKNNFFTRKFAPAAQIRRLRKGMVISMKLLEERIQKDCTVKEGNIQTTYPKGWPCKAWQCTQGGQLFKSSDGRGAV